MNTAIKDVIINNMTCTRLNEHYHACTSGISLRLYSANAFGRKSRKSNKNLYFPLKTGMWPTSWENRGKRRIVEKCFLRIVVGKKKDNIIFVVKKYFNITIELACSRKNKGLCISLDGLHVFSYLRAKAK